MSREPDGAAVDRARDLVGFFHPSEAGFGAVAAVAAADLPAAARALLDHHNHMTVAMERFHGGPVGLEVLHRREDAAGRYAREILLTRPDPRGGGSRSVQYGIVRIDLSRLAPAESEAVRSESIPLGRILLSAGLMTDVHHVALLRIAPGPQLGQYFAAASPAAPETFGRVAEIGLDGVPAIELLEILAPDSWRNGAA
ncbi:MAG: hypothetical protein O3A18_02540 [Planctomycetota bacterium]|jgi:hypothetical protein|nr:hypothetical protein [Planctomycetota bacterium]